VSLSESLDAFMLERNITEREFARLCKMSKSGIWQIKNGTYKTAKESTLKKSLKGVELVLEEEYHTLQYKTYWCRL
jgi:transcriptional regulator with XRE-family HTH domain